MAKTKQKISFFPKRIDKKKKGRNEGIYLQIGLFRELPEESDTTQLQPHSPFSESKTQNKENKTEAPSKLKFRPTQDAFRIPRKKKRGLHDRKIQQEGEAKTFF